MQNRNRNRLPAKGLVEKERMEKERPEAQMTPTSHFSVSSGKFYYPIKTITTNQYTDV